MATAASALQKAIKAQKVKTLSVGEETFAQHLKAHGISAVREYRFAVGYKYRADFALPNRRIIIEIEGGTHSHGRHNRAAGYRTDCEKYNLAATLGLTVLRYTTEMVKSGEAINQVLELIQRTENLVVIDEHAFAHMLVCSFRYSLGRQTYITDTCAGWLISHWKSIPNPWREQIHGDIREAIEKNCAGASCDISSWMRVLELPLGEAA